MRRTTWTATVVIGLTTLLVSPPAYADGHNANVGQHSVAASRTGGASATLPGAAKAVPLVADQQTTRGSANSGAPSRLYRDSLGRTRLESGSLVTITDPATGTTVRLDRSTQTYQRLTRNAPSPRPAAGSTNATLASTPRQLGTTQMQGVRVEGRSYTVTVPARNGRPAQSRDVSMWLSAQAQLPVELRVADGTGIEFVQSYTNIRLGVEPAADLFQVPAGYREAAPKRVTGARINEPCPLFNAPDPLVLNSYDFFLGSGAVLATTDPQIGCFFAADGAAFEYPLSGFPTTPLGLPFDQWVAYDTGGGGLPFLPWVAFGDIAFLAFNGSDTTTKDSLVILTVWCC